MKKASPDPWLKDLRRMVKREYGAGWIIEEQSEKIKILRRMPDGRRPAFITKLPYSYGSQTALLDLINRATSSMQDLGLSFKDAFAVADGSSEQTNGKSNWEEIQTRYKKYRVPNFVTEANFNENEKSRIEKCVAIITADRNAAHSGKELMEKYAANHFQRLDSGSEGRKRALLDAARFLNYAVEECGADSSWLPLKGEKLKAIIGKRKEASSATIPVKPDQLFGLLDSLFDKPELRLAVALVGLYGLRPAELKALTIKEGRLYVGQVKRNSNSADKPKEDRVVVPLDIKELPKEGARVLKQFESGLVKLPTSILSAKTLKDCGAYFRQYLERHPYWQSLVKANQGMTPYSLRHGYAWRGAKYYERSFPIRDLSALMGHDVKTHCKFYGSWTDEKDLIETAEKITAKVSA